MPTLHVQQKEVDMSIVPLLIMGAISVILIAIIISVAMHYKTWVNMHYICPDCKNDFKPAKFSTSMFALFAREYKRLECPKCGLKELMKGIAE
jgi:DNA-directed RNA polymerase subunit RPC12/RpoP